MRRPGRSQARGVARREAEPVRKPGAVTGLVHEELAYRPEEGRAAGAVRWQVHGASRRARERRDARRLAGDERRGRQAGRERSVQREHELVGLVIVGEEARNAQVVDVVRPGGGKRIPAVQRVAPSAHDAEEPRAVQLQVAEDSARLR